MAFSGAKSFMEEYAKNEDQENSGIIGHFGLGFYSVFMIADKVTIDTLSFREGATPVRWESEDGMAFTMTEGTRATRGKMCIRDRPVTGLSRRGLLLSPTMLREEKSRASAHRLAPHRRLSEDAFAR